MRLGAIHLYPIKSTQGLDVGTATVEPWGLAGDRRYMVVDQDGYVVTAREHRRLLLAVAAVAGEGALTVTGPHAPTLRFDLWQGMATRPVEVWDDEVAAVDAGDEAAGWFSALLDLPVRLVWLDDPTRRVVDPAYGRPDDRVSFADSYPLLAVSTTSLGRLNDWIAAEAAERGEESPAPLSMRRFRPSVVVDDVPEPFAEDGWKRIRIGDVPFRMVKPCDRCVLTTIDPDTLAKGKEPIRTLSRHRRRDGKVYFGVNLIPDAPGVIRAGDPVILEDSSRRAR